MIALSKKNLFACVGILIVTLYIFVFLRSVSFGVLATDPAKYALNIAIPHPPLGRWIAIVAQWVFGRTSFAARLPSFLADMLSFVLFFILILKSKKDFSAYLFSLIAINPAVIYWIGQGYQTSFLSCAIALIAYGAMKESRGGFFWIFAGYLLAIWTQLQGLLLFPAVFFLFWRGWREKRIDLQRNDSILWLFLFIIVQSGLVVLWLLTNPLAIADAISLAHRASSSGIQDRIIELLQADFGRLLLVGLTMSLLLFFLKKQERLTLSPLLIILSIFSLYFLKNPASYYTPYVFSFVSWGIIEWSSLEGKQKKSFVLLLIAFVFVVDTKTVMPRLVFVSSGLKMEDVARIQNIASKYPEESMALGNFGYEWNYFTKKRFVRFTPENSIQSKVRAAFVFVPWTLSKEEQKFLSIFPHKTNIGMIEIYER